MFHCEACMICCLRWIRNLSQVSNAVCEAATRSLFWAPNGLNELPSLCTDAPLPSEFGEGERTSVHRLWITGSHFEFPFNLIGKSTMVLLTGQSWRVLKSWYTGGDAEQELWHWLANGLDQNLVSSVAQVTRPAKCFSLMQNCSRFLKVHKTARLQQL